MRTRVICGAMATLAMCAALLTTTMAVANADAIAVVPVAESTVASNDADSTGQVGNPIASAPDFTGWLDAADYVSADGTYVVTGDVSVSTTGMVVLGDGAAPSVDLS